MTTGEPRILQPQEDVTMPTIPEDPMQQRLQRLTAFQQQNAEHLNHVDTRMDQLRHDFRQAMADSALALQRVVQEVRGQAQGVERICHVLFNIAGQVGWT